MKILFVSQYFHPEPFSNTDIARALLQRGHELEVLTAVPNYPGGEFYEGYASGKPAEEMFETAKVHRVRTVSRGKSKKQLIANFLTFAWFGSLRALFGSFRKPDVVFLSQLSPILMAFPAIIFAKRFKVPLVFWVQDIWPESATYTLGLRSPAIVKPITWLSGWIYRQADTVLVQSAAFPSKIKRFGVSEERISVFPNTASKTYLPVDPKQAVEEEKLVPNTGFKIMFAGNIGESQDFDTIIDTAKILTHQRKIQWVIIGSGRDEQRVKSRIAAEDLTNQFTFLGRHPEQRMPLFFSHADAMIVSLKRNDIFDLTVPYKVQSYMACAKPIIASLDGEGARIIKKSGGGVVAPAQSPKELAAAIEVMIDKIQQGGTSYGEKSRLYFEDNYDPERLFDLLCEYCEESIKSKNI